MSYEMCLNKLGKVTKLENPSENQDAGDTISQSNKGIREKTSLKNDAEVIEVEQLDPFLIPVSNGSDIAERLTSKRKTQNDILMQKLADDLNELNMKIEENVRISSDEMKAHMAHYKEHLNNILKGLDKPDVESYHESVFLRIQENAHDMKSRQLRLVKDLYQTLCKLEKIKSKESERIFRASFQEIEKTAYLTSYEVQSFIELEALKINQLMLNNRRCFEDLRLKLLLITEDTFKWFMDEVFCIREKWARCNMINFPDKEVKSQDIILPKPQLRLELQGHEMVFRLSEDKCYSIVSTTEWLENVNNVKKFIELHVSKLIETFKSLQHTIRKGLSNDFDDSRRSVYYIDVIRFEERSIQPILFSSHGEGDERFYDYECRWQSILKQIKTELEYIHDLIFDFKDLWTGHFNRLCESKILILNAIDKADENNRASLQELEVKVNLSLDALRQEYNKEKMEILHDAVTANLDLIKKKLETSYLNAVSIIEEYYKMIDSEAEILSVEIKEFIYTKHPEAYYWIRKNEDRSMKSVSDSGVEKDRCLKPVEDLLIEFAPLRVWSSGMRTALENMSSNTKEVLKCRAEEWIESRIRVLARKYQSELEIHTKRYDRIRTQVYEVRLQEIQTHEEVFQRHKLAVEDSYQKLINSAENLYEKGLKDMELYRVKVEAMMYEAMTERTAATVKSFQTQVNREKLNFNKDYGTQWELIRGEIETSISTIQHSNTKFMKSLRLFHENGNYDADEAKTYINFLDSIEKKNINEGNGLTNEINKKESDLKHKVSEICEEANCLFSQLFEELRFVAETENVIKLCKSLLENVAVDLKMDFDSLIKSTDYANVCVEDENICLNEDHDASWFRLVDAVYRNINNLLFATEPPQRTENSVNRNIEEDAEIVTNHIFTPEDAVEQRKDEKVSGKTNFLCMDFAKALLENTFLSANASNFVTTLFGSFLNHVDYLQRLGCVFYNSNKNIMRKDLLKPNYDEFEKEMFQKFQILALQFELFWAQIMTRLLPILSKIKTLFKAYFEKRIKQFVDNTLRNFDCFEANFFNLFNEKLCFLSNELQKLDSKLLPLHGYSRNKELLNALEDEIIRKTAELDLNWVLFIQKQKEQLKCLHSQSTVSMPEWRTLKRVFINCQEALYAKELGQGVLKYLELVTQKSGFVCKPNITSTSNRALYPKASSHSEMNFTKKFNLNIDLIQLVHNTEISLDEIMQIINSESRESTEEIDSNTSRSNSTLIEKTINFDDIIEPDMKRLHAHYYKLLDLIKSKSNVQTSLICGWLDKWKANVQKIIKLYSVKSSQPEEVLYETSSESIKIKVTAISMAELKTIKSKTKKVCTSSTSMLSKLSQKRLNSQDCMYNISSRKSRSIVNRSLSNEKCLGSSWGSEEKNIQSLIKPIQTDNKPELIKSERLMSNTFLGSASPSKHHSHIPIASKYQKYSRKSINLKRKASAVHAASPRADVAHSEKSVRVHSWKKSKNISSFRDNFCQLNQMDKLKTNDSKLSIKRNLTKRSEDKGKTYLKTILSPHVQDIENNLNITHSYTTITLSSPRAEGDLQTLESQGNSSIYTNEDECSTEGKLFFPSTSISKSSLGCDFDVAPCHDVQCPQPLCRGEHYNSYEGSAISENVPPMELLNLSINDSESPEYSTAAGSFISSPEETESKHPGAHRTSQTTTIRTFSGDELVLSSSMEFDLENEIIHGENDDTIDMLLDAVENDDLCEIDISLRVAENDSKKCDSDEDMDADVLQSTYVEGKTDFPSCSQSKNSVLEPDVSRGRESAVNQRYQENELLQDVTYRQFMYHPTVLKRQSTKEHQECKTRPRSKSDEDKSNFSLDNLEKSEQTKKVCFGNTYIQRSYVSNRDVNINPLRPWSENTPQHEDRQTYDHLQMMQNSEYVLKDVKRERSKRERITGAILRFTAKFIHILAILNLWPGDSCQILMSHSILYRR